MEAEIEAAMPPELVRQPVMPLVALHGMTDLHASLVRHMPLIRAVDLAQLPRRVAKARRSSFEGHVPQGVLKKGWLQKHVLETAASIAALVPWCPAEEGDGLDAVLARVAAARELPRRAGVQVVIVLVATGKVPDDVDQRYAQLYRTAALDGRLSALLVSEPDFALRLGAERLQHMLMDAAWAYFEERTKWSRTVLAHVQRPAQLALVVRHGMKIAFNTEHRDRAAALKQYLETYKDLCDLAGGVTADRHPELKAVAEIINMKVCLILMQVVSLSEAQAQLMRHLATWRLCRGPDGALFLHLAWLARQHAGFASLVDDTLAVGGAVATPLSLLSAQKGNAAMHWEAAAALMGRRRIDALTPRALPPPMPPLPGEREGAGAVFWGQPASGRGRYTPADVHDAWLEEKSVAHGEMVLALVSKAQALHTALGNTRRASSAHLLRARALFDLGRMQECREVLCALLQGDSPLVRDGWLALEAEVLALLLEVARSLQSRSDWVACSLRLIDTNMPFAPDKKKTLLDDLGLMLAAFPLELPAWSPLRALPAALQDMTWVGDGFSTPVKLSEVDLALQPQVVAFEARFEREVYSVGEALRLRLSLRSALVAAVRLAAVVIEFQDPRYCVVLCERGADAAPEGLHSEAHVVEQEALELLPASQSVFDVDLPARKSCAELRVSHVTLHWGIGQCSIHLPACLRAGNAVGAVVAAVDATQKCPASPPKNVGEAWDRGVSEVGAAGKREKGWEVVRVAATEPDATVAIESSGPVLLGEKHHVRVIVGAKTGKRLQEGATLSLLATFDEQTPGAAADVKLYFDSGLVNGEGGTQRAGWEGDLASSASVDLPALAEDRNIEVCGVVTVTGEEAKSVKLRAILVYRPVDGDKEDGDDDEGVRVERLEQVPVVPPFSAMITYAASTSLQCLHGASPTNAPTAVASSGSDGLEADAAAAPAPAAAASGPALAGETVFVKVAVHVISPHGLRLIGAALKLDDASASEVGQELAGGLMADRVDLETGDRYTFLFSIVPKEPAGVAGGGLINVNSKDGRSGGKTGGGVTDVALGRIQLLWERPPTQGRGQGLVKDAVSETEVVLPGLLVRSSTACALVRICAPPQAPLGLPLEMGVILENRGTGSIEMVVDATPSESFLFSGYRHVQVRIASPLQCAHMWRQADGLRGECLCAFLCHCLCLCARACECVPVCSQAKIYQVTDVSAHADTLAATIEDSTAVSSCPHRCRSAHAATTAVPLVQWGRGGHAAVLANASLCAAPTMTFEVTWDRCVRVIFGTPGVGAGW